MKRGETDRNRKICLSTAMCLEKADPQVALPPFRNMAAFTTFQPASFAEMHPQLLAVPVLEP